MRCEPAPDLALSSRPLVVIPGLTRDPWGMDCGSSPQ